MGKIESKTGKISVSDVRIYDFLSDFNNFSSLIPPGKVKNWTSTADTCSFTVDGIGNAALRIVEKTPHSLIKITSEGATPISFILWIQLKKTGENSTAVRIVLEPDVNPMMMVMLNGPLQNFVDGLIDQAEKMVFR
jgi:hypothetical protein